MNGKLKHTKNPGNSIGTEGAMKISDSLITNTSLIELNLRGIKIHNEEKKRSKNDYTW